MAYSTVIAGPADAGPFVVRADGGLSPRGRALAWVIALVLLLIGAGALYGAAAAPLTGAATPTSGAAMPTSGGVPAASTAAAESPGEAEGMEGSGPQGASGVSGVSGLAGTAVPQAGGSAAGGVIPAEWDGPIVHLDWRGTGYSTAGATFVGDRVVSPGDLVHRTLTLVNDGPAAAVLTVLIQVDQHLPELVRNPDLANDVRLFWDAAGVEGNESFTGLLAHGRAEPGAPVPVAQVQVAQGQTVPVTVGFQFGTDIAGQRKEDTDSAMLTFEVLAQLHGDTTAPEPAPEPAPGPELPRALPRTGAAVLGWAAVAGGLLVTGWLLVAAVRRRRRCDDCERRLGRDDRWGEYHLGHGRVHTRCLVCRAELGDVGVTRGS